MPTTFRLAHREWVKAAVADLLMGVLVAVLVAGQTPVLATHSIPSPRWFWDGDQNRVPDQYPEAFRLGGGGWWQNAINRVIEATSHWEVSTNWNPRYEAVNTNYFYVDRPPPTPCGSTTGSGTGGFGNGIARTCTYAIYHPDAVPYYQIWRSNIFIAVGAGYHAGRYQGADNLFDFRGVVTHELGHALRLVDIDDEQFCGPSVGTNFATMCSPFGSEVPGQVPPQGWTYYWRSLHAHDIGAANNVYWAGP